MRWLILFPSSCAPKAARANTCQEHCFFAGAAWRNCHAWAAQAHLERAWQKRGTVRECYSHSTCRPEQRYRTLLGMILEINNIKQIFPMLALCKHWTSLRVQPDRSLPFAINRIYLYLLHLYQEDGVCGILLLSTVPSTLLDLSLLVPQDSKLLVKATLLKIKECIWPGCFSQLLNWTEFLFSKWNIDMTELYRSTQQSRYTWKNEQK